MTVKKDGGARLWRIKSTEGSSGKVIGALADAHRASSGVPTYSSLPSFALSAMQSFVFNGPVYNSA